MICDLRCRECWVARGHSNGGSPHQDKQQRRRTSQMMRATKMKKAEAAGLRPAAQYLVGAGRGDRAGWTGIRCTHGGCMQWMQRSQDICAAHSMQESVACCLLASLT